MAHKPQGAQQADLFAPHPILMGNLEQEQGLNLTPEHTALRASLALRCTEAQLGHPGAL